MSSTRRLIAIAVMVIGVPVDHVSASEAIALDWVSSSFVTVELTRTEITAAQYRTCVAAGACTKAPERKECRAQEAPDAQPVRCVDFEQARAFCKWAGGDLPRDLDWLLVATRGGRHTYPWGEDTASCERAVIVTIDTSDAACGRRHPWPVCSKAGGHAPGGICDLVGNVAEWVVAGDAAEPVPVLRGGSGGSTWSEARASLTKAPGLWSRPERNPPAWVGFRCAR